MDALAKLLAIEEIRQLKARYFRLMDTQDFENMAQVFCRDALFENVGMIDRVGVGQNSQSASVQITRGRDEIMAWIRETFAEQISVHHGHCHEITIDGPTEARGIIAMEDFVRTGNTDAKVIHGAGHYTENYRFEDGAWRIARTKLTRIFLDK